MFYRDDISLTDRDVRGGSVRQTSFRNVRIISYIHICNTTHELNISNRHVMT